MKRIFYLLLIIITFSCQDKFNYSDYKGTWIHIDDDQRSYLPLVTFRNDSVFLEDIYSFVTKGKFKVTRNKIFYYLKNDTIEYDFNYNHKDSTITIDKRKYRFWESFSYNSSFVDYDLINIKRSNKITTDSLSKLDCAMHLFKDDNDSLKIKLNDKIVSDYTQIPRFVILTDKFDYTFPGIYLGKKINIKDLIKVYIRLWNVHIKKSMLILELNIRKNLYSNYLDNFGFWNEQLTLLSGERIEPPKYINNNRKEYLQKYSPELIIITSVNDFNQLKQFHKNRNYLIQINKNLSIENYIILKEIISEIKKNDKISIKTEFIDFLIH